MRWSWNLVGYVALGASLAGAAHGVATTTAGDVDALRAALAGAGPRLFAARIAVAEFYVTHNRMPGSSEELGLPLPSRAQMAGVSIEAAGTIQLTVSRGEPRPALRVFLVPRLSPQGLSWSCVSPDIAGIATVLRGCRFDASYEPRPAPEPATLPNTVIVTIEGWTFRIDPRDYVSGSTATIDPAKVPGLSAQGREQLVETILTNVEQRISRLDDVVYLAGWLASLGPSSRPLLERHLEDKPAIAAAALLALCDVGPRLVPMAQMKHCAATTTPQAAVAVLEINRRVERQLRDPTDHSHDALGGIVDCHAALAVVSSLGAGARPVAAPLSALLGDRRPHVTPGGVDVCAQRDVAVTLLRVLLPDPADRDQADLADAAVLTLVRLTLFDPVRETDARPAGIGSLMDGPDLRARLHDRLSVEVTGWIARCDQVQYSADRLVTDLGVVGFDALLPLLDARANNPPCDPGSAAIRALTQLVRAYPRAAAERYSTVRAVLTRDDLVTAALTLRAAGDPGVAVDLDRLLTQAGVTPFEVRGGRVIFPGSAELHWKPYDEWRVPVEGPPASTAGLQAAYRGFAQQWTDCRIPLDDERIWLSVLRAKRLFVFPCQEDEPALMVIGSPVGFKAMRVPDRLHGVTYAPQDTIVGVSDVDGDGNLEVLIAVPCDGRDAKCAEGLVPDTYEFFEEDGEWFTWFRASAAQSTSAGSQPALRSARDPALARDRCVREIDDAPGRM